MGVKGGQSSQKLCEFGKRLLVKWPGGPKIFGPGIFRGPEKQCIFGKYTIWPSSPGAEYIQVIGRMVFKLSIYARTVYL